MSRSAAGVYYAEYGTTTDVTTCKFCNRKNLPGTVVLLVYSIDGEPVGNTNACSSCAADAYRAAPRRHGKSGDPRLP